MEILCLLLMMPLTTTLAVSIHKDSTMDNESSRKILGSSVVTSVSVIMDTGNGSKAVYADAAGKPMSKPSSASELASPINLLNPDRYEFYTFDDNGDLVKKLMSLEEIQGIIATGDGDGFNFDTFTSEGYMPEKRVNDIVSNVQNVLKEEMEIHKDPLEQKPLFDTPDVSDSWSMILPAIFGNSGEDIKPEKPIIHVTPDTIMIEPTVHTPLTTKKQTGNNHVSVSVTTERSTTARSTTDFSKTTPQSVTPTTNKLSSTTQLSEDKLRPMINVEIYSNSKSTTEKSNQEGKHPVVEIKPMNNLEKASTKPIPTGFTKNIITTVRPTTLKISQAPIRTTVLPYSTLSVITTFKNVSGSPVTQSTTHNSLSSKPPQYSLSSRPQFTSSTHNYLSSRLPITPIRTSERPPSTTTALPTFSELLNKLQAISSTSNSATDHKFETTTDNVQGGLTTFSYVESDKSKVDLTTEYGSTEQTNTPTMKPASQDDFYAASTKYFGYNTKYNKIPLSTMMAEDTITTQIPLEQSLDTMNKISASEVLDQLLLTSTNIYEINTELAKKQILGENPYETTTAELGDATQQQTTEYVSTKLPQEIRTTLQQQSSTIRIPDIITTHKVPEEIETTEQPSTIPSNILNSIEHLLSQAVGNIEETVFSVNDSLKVEQIMQNTNKKNMSNVVKETATIASSLMDNFTEQKPTISSYTEQVTAEETSLLNNAVESLLSQVYGLDEPNLTTIEPYVEVTDKQRTTIDVKTTAISNRKTDETEDFTQIDKITEKVDTNYDVTSTTEDLDDYTTLKPTTSSLADKNVINVIIIKKPLRNNTATNLKTENINEILLTESSNSVLKNSSSSTSNAVEDDKTVTTQPTTYVDRVTEQPEILSTTKFIIDTATEFTTTTQNSFDLDQITETTTETVRDDTTIHKLEYNTEPVSQEPVVFIQKTPTEIPTVVITITEDKNSSTLRNTSENHWTLVSTVPPHGEEQLNITKPSGHPITNIIETPSPVDLVPKPLQGFGLEDSTSGLDTDIYQFIQLCNELAFGFWKSVTSNISSARSVIVSPFSATSLLAMVFLGARGSTSGEMNEILKLDDMVTFNPHLIFKNVTESITNDEPNSGFVHAVILRELFSDKSRGKLLGFYKARVKQFYNGHVEEVSFKEIGDVIRRRTNLLVKKETDDKIMEYLKDSNIKAKPPLAGIGVNIFQTDCSKASTDGRDGELHFVVLPSIRQRRLIPIPAVVYRSDFLAGYEPSLDATAVSLGTKDQTVSTILVIPGQQGIAAPGDGLARLEKRLVESSFKKGAWSRLLRSLIPRPGLEVQIPRFSHKSIINASLALKRMGLNDLFNADKADLKGLNGVANELHLSDMLQINNFATCGEDKINDTHHSEIYPATTALARNARQARLIGEEYFYRSDMLEEPRDYQRAFHDPLHDPSYLSLPLPLRPRQARIPEAPRLRFDRPFLYFVRHNPTGLILHMGRFNPRLLP